MGNSVVTPCFHPYNRKLSSSSSSASLLSSTSAKLIFWQGTTRLIDGELTAGEILFEFPETMICHADSFFIGHAIPSLSLDDELVPGEAYFVLPIDLFSCKTLSVSSLLSLKSSHNNDNSNKSTIKFGEVPFEYLKDSDGKVLIKVMPEFITRLVNGDRGNDCSKSSFLCSTPELKKHYEMLVKSKDRVWSPKLETILENKVRLRKERKREKAQTVFAR
ncbi:hypothetical protein TSUD_131860 [Trifolium subterraneum]|uniref:DUF4228 domain-containing protein n=1 Tax=Trifolium subterraneum TaxID=3900 RepID=A0A2Z6LKL6_TRISU|nr:hypothetical protein TSUD_131860 [Trifolium subterraneum]